MYLLDIYEYLVNRNVSFGSNAPPGCFRFGLWITAAVNVSASTPFVTSVTPSLSGITGANFTVRVGFSAPVFNRFRSDADLLAQIVSGHAADMALQPGGTVVPPVVASFDVAFLTLRLVYPLSLSGTYVLTVVPTLFQDANNVTFISTVSPTTYQTLDCNCNNHGTCQMSSTGGDPVCSCTGNFVGERCDACAPGFHGAGDACVANVPCQDSSCSGHGTCDSSSGAPQCYCDLGYASDGVSASLCNICAAQYTGFPNCQLVDDVFQRDARCKAPLLPDTFNGISYLATTDSFHLQDSYFLDLQAGGHAITFQVSTPSVFRFYVEEHWVDVDLVLEARSADNLTWTPVVYTFSLNDVLVWAEFADLDERGGMDVAVMDLGSGTRAVLTGDGTGQLSDALPRVPLGKLPAGPRV